MKTTTLDETRRGVFPPPFKPGDTFERRVESPERMVFLLQKPRTEERREAKQVQAACLLANRLSKVEAENQAFEAFHDTEP